MVVLEIFLISWGDMMALVLTIKQKLLQMGPHTAGLDKQKNDKTGERTDEQPERRTEEQTSEQTSYANHLLDVANLQSESTTI